MKVQFMPPTLPRIGFVGLGKLGLPCAAAMSTVLNVPISGYDKNEDVKTYVSTATVPYLEEGVEDYINSARLTVENSVEDVVRNSDFIFVAVQTPHDPEYEGITPTPNVTKNFEYTYLEAAITDIRDAAVKLNKENLSIVVISTVLPGTIRSRILPIVSNTGIEVLYNPYFIAMGTTIYDFLNPEFVIIGSQNPDLADQLSRIYSFFLKVPVFTLRYEEAELIKVAYNTFIGMKIVFANTLAEITASFGVNVDRVTHALGHATNRLISTKYLSAGMGDGGGCHPRDQIAMSWLAEDINLSFDIFSALAKARDAQTKRHAEIIQEYFQKLGHPVVILGEAYKKNTNLTIGSPSKLLQHYLTELSVPFTVFDPVVYPEQSGDFQGPHLFYTATPHDIFKSYALPLDSTVLDPWGYCLSLQYSVKYVYLGRGGWG